MSTDYTKYLATEILSEQRTLSYRNLARAQTLHVNVAKCMLYNFYETQTKRKPNSLYATYLIAGVKKQEKPAQNGTTNGVHQDEDEPMPSSPPPFTSSMLEPSQQESESGRQVVRKTVTLVREEALESRSIGLVDIQKLTILAVKEQYETITSIHIYSLSPTKIPDLVTLTDIGRGLYTDVFAKEDPLLHNKTYGVIQNSEVRRKKGKRPVIPTASTSKFQPVKEQTKPATTAANSKPSLKKEETASRPSSRDSNSTRDSKQPTLKRGGSDIFKAFAKTQPPKPKDDSQDAKMSDAPKLEDDNEGESEDEALFLDTGTRKPARKRTSDAKREREDKAAKLRKMMDSDDDEPVVPKVEDEAAKASGPLATDKAPEGDDDEEGVTWSDSDKEGKTEKDVAPEQSGPKRKRGKRKVMKKRTTKDEDGYLVTKEEAVWESFSESDNELEKKAGPLQKSAFGKTQSSQPSSQKTAAGAKAGAKKGKGDIMSFFGKK